VRHPADFDPANRPGNRNQPRVPAGHHDGGQWTDGKVRELSTLRLKFAGPLTSFLSRLRARPRPSPPPPIPLPPSQMAPANPPWEENSPPLQPDMPDRPAMPDRPTKPFDLNRCLNTCAMGNVSEMEKFCRAHTAEGTPERELCWEGVADLEAGDTDSCESRCRGIPNRIQRRKK
jgi:hypothetical protein